MRTNLLVLTVVAAIVLAAASPTAAHHAWQLDRSRQLNLKGTVTSFAFSNPHVQVFFDVKDEEGQTANWNAGGASPNRLARSGWTRETLKPGDEIIVSGYRSRTGPSVMRFDSVALADGQPIGGYVGR